MPGGTTPLPPGEDAAPCRVGGVRVRLDDGDLGTGDEEGVGDARAHASATEDADVGGEAGGEGVLGHVYFFFRSDLRSMKSCIRIDFR